jgi:hypothetical protein
MNTYNCQKTVYLLALPKDVCDLILSFIFYDRITGEARQIHHIHIRKIIFRFANASISRTRDLEKWTNPDTDEHWCICLNNTDECNENQFQEINCKKCGEYKYSNIYNIRILCQCTIEDD